MKIIDQSVEYVGICPANWDDTLLRIEEAARTCYRSEPKGSPGDLAAKLLKPKPPHLSVFEHSNVVVRKAIHNPAELLRYRLDTFDSKWITQEFVGEMYYMYGNLRAWMEKMQTLDPKEVYCRLDKLGFRSVPVEQQPRRMRRVTARLITDRAVLAEITRHRDDTAFSVQSQRYVDYKNEILYIKPSWYENATGLERDHFFNVCHQNEYDYKRLRSYNQPPQHARVVLNNQVATEIVMSAYLNQWDWVFKLRRGAGAYPQMVALMDKTYDLFKSHGHSQ